MNASVLTRSEAERQLAAAVARHREAVAALDQGGRSPAGETSAAGAVARGAALIAYTLRRAQSAGVSVERMAEISTWDADVIREALTEGVEPVLLRALPRDLGPDATERAAETLNAMAQIDQLLREISADLIDVAAAPGPADLDELHDRLDRQWRAWRHAHQVTGGPERPA